VIKSFRDKQTEKVFQGQRSRKFGNLANAAERKLNLLDAAVVLADLKAPPGNRLEALKDDRLGRLLRLEGRGCLRRRDRRLPLRKGREDGKDEKEDPCADSPRRDVERGVP
jgi:hypothetical protein